MDGSGVIYKDRFIEDRYSKISDVKLIWQTAPDLLSVSHGQGVVNVKPNEAGTVGNASCMITEVISGWTVIWER